MKNYFSKNILIALIVICFAISVSVFILYNQRDAQPISNLNLDPFGNPWPVPSSPRKDEWMKTAIYRNEKYHYSIIYPAHLSVYEFHGAKEDVYFEDETSVGVMSIQIMPAKYMTVDDELAAENSTLLHEKDNAVGKYRVMERKIKISGYDAIITYPADKIESFPYEKTALMIKDQLLFRIYTAGIDHERVWNSFKFE